MICNIKNIFLILFVLLINGKAKAQISIMTEMPNVVNVEVQPYDSLTNLKEQKEGDWYGYRHLKGQTIMYCGDPWKYNYYEFLSKSPIAQFNVGDYFYIKDVEIYKGSSLKVYCVFVVENTKTHQEYRFDCYTTNRNWQWVVQGYYEKQKANYLGKEFVYRVFDTSYDDIDKMFSLGTDEVKRVINDGSVWKCVDVTVKLRTGKEWKYKSNDYRCPIVLVLENPTYGKCYCYLEDEFGTHYSITNKTWKDYDNGLPLVCGKFQDKIAYDKIKVANAKIKAQRLASLAKKYGSKNAKDIVNGYIRIGMTKQMCKEAWGEPYDINKTTTSYGTHEQWCYGNNYVYFEGNKITAIQN